MRRGLQNPRMNYNQLSDVRLSRETLCSERTKILFKYNLSKVEGSKGKLSLIKKYLYVGFVKNKVKKRDRFRDTRAGVFPSVLSLAVTEISDIDHVK
jgi:hypothetical protein